MSDYDEGRDLMLDLARQGRPFHDERWLRVWNLAEQVAPGLCVSPVDVVGRWRRHAEVVLEFGDELEGSEQ